MKIKLVLIFYCLAMFIPLCIVPSHVQALEKNGLLASPVSGQVGMYSYRVKDLLGYTKIDNRGREVKKIVIQRDAQGRIVKKTHFDHNGQVKLEIIYRFDSRDRLVKKIKQTSQGHPLKINQYSYNVRKNMCTHVTLDGYKTLLKTHYYYFNQNGERIRKTTYNAENQLIRTQLYIFDGSGRRIKDYTLSSEGSISKITQYQYDGKGDMKWIQYFDKNFKLKGKSLISMGNSQRPEKKNRFDATGELKYSIRYDY
ncbi:hypothetical protein SAMN02746065_101311 [Desulfocicer vacuolatum DSM 3385]|uniref:YD repeat-containing protein n=2 Tax=Desulfocicer vacuolatum TaxID=2298 RepID=A0A1W1YS42_9BACT|nr:hypothetical protein SAMN02746065_101311 [Desulfocicer vacuolatum DSM 3385]